MSVRIGIQGLAASYSDAALLQTAGHATKVFCDSFSDAFAALAAGKIDKAFLPFENSTSGFIAENYQLLQASGYYITDEYLHRVEHCLLGPIGSRLSDIKVVISHPQALAQCSRFLKDHGLRTEPYFDTAGAARDISQMPGRAAVASMRASQLYNLEVLMQNINDEAVNWTRFLTIEKKLSWSKRAIFSATAADFQGLMADVSQYRFINLLSQPMATEVWGHRYYIELASDNPAVWKDLMTKHKGLTVLGSFDAKR
ncbi:MAG: bifunctional chorismate mutase/prephenate dehydratase [Proteobacteria bacterium]|nr:MAG: bifunctional chorismate mutase/prephenate dehydratase [Pseudomonadota bacterium]